MLKKVIAIVLSLCLIFSISVMTVCAVDETAPDAQQGAGERPVKGRGGMPARGEMPSGDFTPPEGFTPPSGDFTPPENFTPPSGDFTPPEGFTPPSGDFTPGKNSGEFTPPTNSESNNAQTTAPKADEGVTKENQQMQENSDEAQQTQGEGSPFGSHSPEGMGRIPGNMQSSQNTAPEQTTGFLGFVKTYSAPITSVVLLGLAFIFVIFYRRRNY